MKIDFAKTLMDLEGAPLKLGEQELTLRRAATTALLSTFDDERNLDAQQKFERYLLATTVQKAAKPIALKAADVAALKRLIGKAFSPIVVGASWPLLDPAESVRSVADDTPEPA